MGRRDRAIRSDPKDVSHARKRTTLETFANVGRYLRRYPWFASLTMACAILSLLMGLAYPKFLQWIIDDSITAGRLDLLAPLVLGLAGAYFFRDVFNGLRLLLNNTFEQHVIFDIRKDIYAKLQRLPVPYYDQRSTGDIMTRVMDDVTAFERVLIDGLEQGTVAVLALIGVSYMLFHMNAQLAPWAMVPIPILGFGAFIYTKFAHSRYRAQRRALSDMNALLHDNLQGIRQIKGFARQGHELNRFKERANALRLGSLRVMRTWATYNPAMTFVAAMGTILVIYFGGQLVIQGALSVGELVGFLAYLGMFYDPISRLHGLNQLFQAGRAAGERIFDILDAPDEAVDSAQARPFPSTPVKGSIRFSGVHFEYASGLPVLHDINFEIKSGETVAFVGPTGAGKSSILNLLPRFYEITRGRIEIDGCDTRKITLQSLREQIGVVSQEPFLFNGTIRENILFGKLNATEDEMIAAARAANAHEFIARLPDGYDSNVGERGVKLSVGEKQRVSIARALLKDPPILLLDEATASVDTATEKLIQEALERLMAHRTCLMIAHRLSTVRHADMILVIDRGRITERGNHSQLLEQGGLYAHLCRIQTTASLTIEDGLRVEGF
jgi:ATP-binding cassette, subfamily B, bacterial